MSRVTEAHVEARRSQILDAAWSCFARSGYHQTTMQEIADEAGLSAGAIYRYFEGKEAVLKAINDRSQELGREVVAAARARAQGPLDALAAIGVTMLSYFKDPMVETTTRVNIEIWPEVLRNESLREGMRREIDFWRRTVTDLLREAKELGQLKEDVDPASLAVVQMATWEGLRHYSLLDPEHFTPERFVEVVKALVGDRPVADLEQAVQPDAGPLGLPFTTRPSGKDGE